MRLPGMLAVAVLALLLGSPRDARGAGDAVDLHAYVNDACIVADEPFYLAAEAVPRSADGMTPKILPLLGLVVGKLAELFINHEIDARANQIKSKAVRKDTRYALSREMNLYRADTRSSPALGINARLGCLTIVAAKLLPANLACTTAYVPKQLDKDSVDLPQEEWKTSRGDDSVENQLRRANICVDGRAAAVYEARFEFSRDATAYRLRDAGYRINSLLTTTDARATRTALYTLKISQPAVTDQQEVLSSAWIKLGTVTAGARSKGGGDDAAPWLRVPPPSADARRAYEEKTNAQQEVMGQIDALKRALTRNQRVLDGLDQRIAAAHGDLAEGLKQERTKLAVQIQVQGAELEARNAEYRDLPHENLEFMPVTIEVAVTETESEKKAELALADLIGSSSGMVASAVGNATTSLLSKDLAESDLKTNEEPLDGGAQIAGARARYYDALVAYQAGGSDAGADGAAARLSRAKSGYNAARKTLGLEPIQ